MKGKPLRVEDLDPEGVWTSPPSRARSEPPTLPPLYREPPEPPRARPGPMKVVAAMFVLATLMATAAINLWFDGVR